HLPLIAWLLLAQGGAVAAVLVPVHTLTQRRLGPLRIVPVVARHYHTWVAVLGHPIVKLYPLGLIAVPFFHIAHRVRYLLTDFGVKAAKSVPAQIISYGGAVLVTLITIWVLLPTVPIKIG